MQNKVFNKHLQFIIGISIFIITSNVSFGNIFSEVNINTKIPYGSKINPFQFGIFFEYVDYQMLSSQGLLAQELNSRGFDFGDRTGKGAPDDWLPYNLQTKQKIKVLLGGYNPNGKFYVNLENQNEGEFGIKQRVWLDTGASYCFYLYARENSKRGVYKLKLKLIDFNEDTTIKEFIFPKFDSVWKKYEIIIEPIPKLYSCYLVISAEGNCDIDIDETSLISKENKFQIRRAFYDMLEKWKPGIARYPGGCFSDTRAHHLDYAIGDIDKRESPNIYDGIPQRMEFGYDEFMQFCDTLGIEPHLVLNLVFGTPIEAANTVEYLNLPANTYYGNKRAANGRTIPFNVKYWELGNEQWGNTPKMTSDYLAMYHAMKKKDSTIKFMVDGDLWGGKGFFDRVYNAIDSNCNIYSWHLCSGYDLRVGNTSLETYKYLMGTACKFEYFSNSLNNLLGTLNFKQSLGLTELWTSYNDLEYNCHPMHYTLERGLWLANMLMNSIKYDKNLDLVEITWNSGMVKTSFKSSGERIYLATPSLLALLMMKENIGKYKFLTSESSPVYSQSLNKIYYSVENVPWVEYLATGDTSYIYLAIVNKHYSDSASIKVNINDTALSEICTGEIITSNSYLDSCSAENPNNILRHKRNFDLINGFITLPPISFSIIKIPIKNSSVKPIELCEKSKVYPNPNSGSFVLQLSENTSIKTEIVTLYDIIGNEIYRKEIPGIENFLQMYLPNLPVGIYFLKLSQRKENLIISITDKIN
ncbi:MAG: T9SS type A sorting domain-containing protein [Bacteroidota bacterium]